MAIGNCTDVFRGFFLVWGEGEVEDGGGVRGRIFLRRNLLWGKRISMKGAKDFLALSEKKVKK